MFVLAFSWLFGREFVDGTLKDMLAVPVQRSSILMAKFIVVAVWSAAMAAIMLIFSWVVGAMIKLPGGSLSVILNGFTDAAITVCPVIAVVMPFALFASLGRGYMLPMAMAVLALVTANLLMVVGWAEYFPWAVSMLYAQGESSLRPISYWIVLITSLAGMIGTYLWWKPLVPGLKVVAVDTTAAGDTFNGALAVFLAEDKAMPEAIDFANAAAALSVTRHGAQASIPSRSEVDALGERD